VPVNILPDDEAVLERHDHVVEPDPIPTETIDPITETSDPIPEPIDPIPEIIDAENHTNEVNVVDVVIIGSGPAGDLNVYND